MENSIHKVRTAADRFLLLLKTRGPQTAAELAGELRITSEGARLQLLKLADEGLVVATTTAKGVGRPVQRWDLTGLGHARFPDAHAELSLQLLETIRHEFGENALDKVIAAREKEQLEKYTQALHQIVDIEERIAVFASIRTTEGYLAEWRRDEEGFLFIENHCPICSAATKCESICISELRTFRTILGEQVSISRIDHIVAGSRRCAYRIVV
ncbi:MULTISPECIES: metalloregulator ArsR/SmtB family transcription factor [Chitinophaga]|uniref:helix-turn-helix transcriptional regulator n=1 Tax=Chitinophaga TaxID=79328 RepID=UPI000BB083BC|nr:MULTISPECIES: metalloregulator ArsR/SmtB family transcription factor [Chitinophaga]ASZ13350.1 MarR family transcriptional regulator [Chitinophaga sp. MD30]